MKQLIKKAAIALHIYPIIQNWRNKKIRKSTFENAGKEIAFNAQFIKKDKLCFDIGANMGYKSDIFLSLGAKVIAVEPQPQCVKHLEKHFRNNKNITVLDIGLAEKKGELELFICDEASTITTMSDKWKDEGRFSEDFNWNTKVVVKVDTLDNLIKKYGTPHFCKIDVEGFEESVLKGLSSPIPFISFEFTKEFFGDVNIILNHLMTIGTIKVNFSLYDNYALHFREYVNPDTLYEAIQSMDGKLNGDIYVNFI